MSVLGTLFSDIAAAIREKTGETGTMKPAQFPEKIRGIETGGGAKLVAASGIVEPTATVMTVEHNLGVVPDIVIFVLRSGTTKTHQTLIYALGGSQAAIDSSGGTLSNTAVGKTYNLGMPYGVDRNKSNQVTYGMIRQANASTFVVGGATNNTLDWSSATDTGDRPSYEWVVIGGLT